MPVLRYDFREITSEAFINALSQCPWVYANSPESSVDQCVQELYANIELSLEECNVPIRKCCSRSKPWWKFGENLTELKQLRNKAKRVFEKAKNKNVPNIDELKNTWKVLKHDFIHSSDSCVTFQIKMTIKTDFIRFSFFSHRPL